jgi:thiol reductant ABC exporter CydD subunit
MASTATLWRAAPRARSRLFVAVAAGLLASGLWYAILVGVAAIIAAVFVGGAGLADVAPSIVALGVLLVLRAGLVGAAEIASQAAATEVKAALRASLARALMARAPGASLGRRTGELVHLVTDEVERLDDHVARYLPARYGAVLGPAVVLVAIAAIDPLTLPILLFAGPLLVIVLALIGRTTRARTARRERELAWMDGHFLDMVRGLPTLRLFGRAEEQVGTIDMIARRLADRSLDVLRTAFQTSLVLEWGATAATALVAIAASVRLMAGDLAFERALAVLLLTPEFFVPIRQLASRYHAGAAGEAALEHIATELAPAEAAAATTAAAPADRVRLPGTAIPLVAIRGLTVRYDDRDRPALDGVDLDLEPGRYTVLTGPTGAGKSTLVAVLLRFVEPESGSVVVDGADLAAIDPATWRRRIAWVPQRPHLFDGSVADNVRLGRPGASAEEVAAAVAAAGAAGFVAELGDGYATRVGEGGARLSGGQRQRLAIARALLRDAPLLIVDEPTSHLDAASASVVRATLRSLRGRRTILAIAHDPAIVADADLVVALDGGGRLAPVVPSGRAAPVPAAAATGSVVAEP